MIERHKTTWAGEQDEMGETRERERERIIQWKKWEYCEEQMKLVEKLQGKKDAISLDC
jgi:hypothetical protein